MPRPEADTGARLTVRLEDLPTVLELVAGVSGGLVSIHARPDALHEEDRGPAHLTCVDDLEAEPGIVCRGGYINLNPADLAFLAAERCDGVLEILSVVGIRKRVLHELGYRPLHELVMYPSHGKHPPPCAKRVTPLILLDAMMSFLELTANRQEYTSVSKQGGVVNMLHEFKIQEEVNLEALCAFNDELKDILLLMHEDEIFTDGIYTQEQFQRLLNSFVAGQRGPLGRTKQGSWSIAPNDTGMDGDARVEFIFLPTYLVAAIMSRTLCDYPLIADAVSGFRRALKDGLLFCAHRELFGHGYDLQRGAAEALTILAMGKVPQILEQDRSLCPKLYRAIVDRTKEMQASLSEGTHFDAWGGNLQEDFTGALETLYVINDKETLEAICNADKGSELLSEEDLSW